MSMILCNSTIQHLSTFHPYPYIQILMELKGMTFDHDFCYFILLFSSLLNKEGREKENDVAKIVIKSHTFLFHPNFFLSSIPITFINLSSLYS